MFIRLLYTIFFFSIVICDYNEMYTVKVHHNKVSCNSSSACSRKCCDIKYQFLRNGSCVFVNSSEFSVPVYIKKKTVQSALLNFTFSSGLMECQMNYGFYHLPYFKNFIHVGKDGKLVNRDVRKVYDYNEFCLDTMEEKIVVVVCIDDNESMEMEQLTADEGINIFGMIISLPFLLLTFIIYAMIPDRKLHGTALMCYVASLFAAFLLAVSVRLDSGTEVTEDGCIALGVFCTLFFMSSYCWMNIMSIDIWSTFSGRSGFKTSRKYTEQKRLIYYGLYGWGVPILVAIIVTCLSIIEIDEDTWYNPGIGENLSCWYRDSLRELLYFYGPMAITLVINMVLFIATAFKIKQVQKDTEMLRDHQESQTHSQNTDKQRFCLYIKLFLVMGVNWTMELITWIVDWLGRVPVEVWYITNFCNAMYGVLIFFLFCFNKKIWNLLKQRWRSIKYNRSSGITQTTSAASPKNSFSMTKRSTS